METNKQKYIRLTAIELQNIKNVSSGKVDFPINENVEQEGFSNVFGIYGPNGSGKTSMITAVAIIKNIVCGANPNKNEIAKFINIKSNKAKVALEFICFDGKNDFKYRYELSLMSQDMSFFDGVTTRKTKTVNIAEESLSFLGSKDDKSTKKFASVSLNDNSVNVSPAAHYNGFFKNNQDALTEQFFKSKLGATSFLFSDLFLGKLKSHGEFGVFVPSLIEFKKFVMVNLFVIDQAHNNDVFLNLNYRSAKGNSIVQMNSTFVNYRIVLPDEEFLNYKRSIDAANVLLETLIPHIKITIDDRTIMDTVIGNNIRGKSFEIVSIRDGNFLPMSLESNGIRSLFAIASLLITAYSDRSVTIAIDEFDSGVFEYLLGGILEIYKESGKGLFIFTSHNLRPLEILGKNNIYFTVEKSKNIFKKYPYIQPGANFRNQYIKSLYLGSEEDDFHFSVKKGDIRKAFLKAVSVYNG